MSRDLGIDGRAWLAVGCAVAAAAACGDSGTPSSPSGPRGRVVGSLSVFTPGVANAPVGAPRPAFATKSILSAARRHLDRRRLGRVGRGLEGLTLPIGIGIGGPEIPAASSQASGFVPGELLVSFREQGSSEVASLDRVPGLGGYRFETGVYGGPDVATVRVRDRARPDRVIGPDETRWIRERLAPHEAFAAVELNHYRWALAVPNDQVYAAQWHYAQINLPATWDITTGSSQVVVAVIDDGINRHPDLDRVIPGYDMISDPTFAGDGDGRDARPEQVPLSHGTSSVWHGTHVAGTVGATSNNQIGAAGVDWQARLQPVRVLGRVVPGAGQGTSIDIIAGINWAAGVDVPGVPSNATPAQVLNLSLGGGGLVQAEQDAISAAVARGTVVVVAAGNENRDAGGTSLGGYDDVIVVGAVDHGGQRAPYSNFGSVIDVMAPGGHMGADANADGRPDGVLSTYLDAQGQQAGLQFLEGTSMASPHVAGVAALMKAVRPSISPAEIETILKETANSAKRCNEGCGAGLINAAAAVLRAQGTGDPNRPPGLALGSERLNLGARDRGSVQIFNSGGGTLDWQARLEGQNAAQLSLTAPTSGQLAAGAVASIEVTANRAGLQDGDYQGVLVVQAGAAEARAAVIFRVGQTEVQDVGAVVIAAVGFDEADEVVIAGAVETDRARGYRFELDAEPGSWLVIALADRNGNEELDAGDYWGLHASLDSPQTVEVQLDGRVEVPAFDLVPYTGEADAGPPPCGEYRSCIEACAGNPVCESGCPVSTGCQDCFANQVATCGSAAGCGGDDIGCLCTSCESSLDACFGPLLCSGSGSPTMPTTAGLGGACGPMVSCETPYACDTSVAGGYCTRSCFQDGACGGGVCVEVDPNNDGTPDDAFCFATCTGPGTCPRVADLCIDVGGIGACVPE